MFWLIRHTMIFFFFIFPLTFEWLISFHIFSNNIRPGPCNIIYDKCLYLNFPYLLWSIKIKSHKSIYKFIVHLSTISNKCKCINGPTLTKLIQYRNRNILCSQIFCICLLLFYWKFCQIFLTWLNKSNSWTTGTNWQYCSFFLWFESESTTYKLLAFNNICKANLRIL